ncbi:hypothetical protein [Methylocaldum sp.]|uniref:hypothetical protein n=1 Tax=Methylocaldum sp. TaxID=1969727 RepID=UPI002D3D2F5D|nr:hypothetical protein [Methylocaldum sp.]HYE38213.1 hypothetical protein [Methylocaldum sp.]
MAKPQTAGQREWQVSACKGKARFANGTLAHRVAKERAKKKGAVIVYHCRWCGQYHHGRPQ